MLILQAEFLQLTLWLPVIHPHHLAQVQLPTEPPREEHFQPSSAASLPKATQAWPVKAASLALREPRAMEHEGIQCPWVKPTLGCREREQRLPGGLETAVQSQQPAKPVSTGQSCDQTMESGTRSGGRRKTHTFAHQRHNVSSPATLFSHSYVAYHQQCKMAGLRLGCIKV